MPISNPIVNISVFGNPNEVIIYASYDPDIEPRNILWVNLETKMIWANSNNAWVQLISSNSFTNFDSILVANGQVLTNGSNVLTRA
jgi:hypothetical protein